MNQSKDIVVKERDSFRDDISVCFISDSEILTMANKIKTYDELIMDYNLEDFKILNLIGKGFYGKVYRV